MSQPKILTSRTSRLSSGAFLSAACLLAIGFGWPTRGLAADPTPLLEYGGIAAAGGTLNITRLPIQLQDGSFIYEDVTINLKSDPTTGKLSFAAPPLVQKKSPPLKVDHLKAGVYVEPTANEGFGLMGPFVVAGQGYSQWTITAVQGVGADCGGPATIYTGNVTNSPIGARLAKANITSTEFNYGVVGTGAYCSNPWAAGYLIGVEQLGNQLKIASFTLSGVDKNTPVSFYLLNLQQ